MKLLPGGRAQQVWLRRTAESMRPVRPAEQLIASLLAEQLRSTGPVRHLMPGGKAAESCRAHSANEAWGTKIAKGCD